MSSRYSFHRYASERPEDIPHLVKFLTYKIARRMKRTIDSIPAETLRLLRCRVRTTYAAFTDAHRRRWRAMANIKGLCGY